MELGETAEVYGDFESGLFIDGFDGFWFSLPDEQLIAAYVVDYSEDGQRAFYTSPVYVNGSRTNLRFWQEGTEIHVEGAWDGIDEYGMAARQVRKLESGDKVTPVYYLEDDTEFEGLEYEWEEGDDLTYTYLPEGEYFYAFFIDDAYGDYYTSDYVTFRIDENGEIFFVPDEYAGGFGGGYGNGYDYGYDYDYGYGDYGYDHDYGYGDYDYDYDYGYGYY